jgi:hypothetical protein
MEQSPPLQFGLRFMLAVFMYTCQAGMEQHNDMQALLNCFDIVVLMKHHAPHVLHHRDRCFGMQVLVM